MVLYRFEHIIIINRIHRVKMMAVHDGLSRVSRGVVTRQRYASEMSLDDQKMSKIGLLMLVGPKTFYRKKELCV